MLKKRFAKNDSGFICEHCGVPVKSLMYSSRNHCPFCLHSKHVDIHPGDRACECRGIMAPVSVEQSGKKGTVLVFKCISCGEVKKNKAAADDSYEMILQIMQNA